MDGNEVPVAVLAGGLATRLQPITRTIPKSLVPVAGKPFIDHQLELFRRHGFHRVVLCVGHFGELLREHVGYGARFGLDVQYSFDGPRLLGTAGALKLALPLLGREFWVVYGDSYLDFDYRAVRKQFAASKATGLMTVYRNCDAHDASNVIFRENRLVCYNKLARTKEMEHIDYGATLLRAEALAGVAAGIPTDLASIYSDLVANGRMSGYEVHERFYEIGSPAGLAEAAERLSRAA